MSPTEKKSPEEFKNVWRLLGIGAALLLILSCWYPTDAYRDLGSMIQLGWLLFFLGTGASAIALKVSLPKSGLAILGVITFLSLYLLVSKSWAPYEPMAHLKLGALYTGLMVGGGALFWTLIGCRFGFFSQRVVVGFLCGVIALLAIHGVYQVIGPASFPNTFASNLKSLRENSDLYSQAEFLGLEHALSKARATSRIGSPNIFASFLVLGIPLAFWGFREFAKKWQKAVFAVILAAILWAIVMSVSRGGMLSAAVAIALSTFFLIPNYKKLLKVGSTGVFVLLTGSAIANQLVEKLGGLSTLQQRFYYWEAAIGIWKTTPILGAGPGSFELLYAQFRVPGSQETRLAHSWFFSWLSEFGLVGLSGFLLLVTLTFYFMMKASRGRKYSSLSYAFLVSLFAVLLHGLIEYSFAFTAFIITCGAFWGVGLGISCPEGESNPKSRLFQVSLVSLLGISFAILWYQGSLVPGRVEDHREYAEAAFYSAQYGLAEEEITKAIKWESSNSELYEFRSLVRQRLGKDGMPDIERALNAQPSSARLHEQMALINASVGNMADAIKWQKQAVDLHPLDASHRMTLADLYLGIGEPESAKSVLKGIAEFQMNDVENKRLPKYEELLLTE